jgi:hypothetical protein
MARRRQSAGEGRPEPGDDAALWHRVNRASVVVCGAAVLLVLYFQGAKAGPLRAVSPFLGDPYELVGSLGVQVALVVAVLTFARGWGLAEGTLAPSEIRLIRSGQAVVVSAIATTLGADAVAVCLHPTTGSNWGRVLLGGLAGMALVVVVAAAVAWWAFAGAILPPAPSGLTLADTLDDLLELVRLPARHGWVPGRRLRRALAGADADRLFARLGPLHPRRHPWRLATACGILAGAGLALAHLQEGLPPSVAAGMAAAAILVAGEAVAVVGGFVLLGGFLGMRPAWRRPGGGS